MSESSSDVVALVRDLMFTSKITATGRSMNVPVTVVRDPARLADTPGRLLLVDLNLEGAIPAAVAWVGAAEGRRAIGFVAHVDTESIFRARQAGIDRILTRGQFSNQLPHILTGSRE